MFQGVEKDHNQKNDMYIVHGKILNGESNGGTECGRIAILNDGEGMPQALAQASMLEKKLWGRMKGDHSGGGGGGGVQMSRGRSELSTLKTQEADGAAVAWGRGRVVGDEFREVKGGWILPCTPV